MRYLLDTNIISNVIAHPLGKVARRVRTEVMAGNVFTSIIVVSELRFGYTKVSSKRLKEAYDRFLGGIVVENWERPFDHVYAELRAEMERKGKLIGTMDMLIATHAVATDAIVVTANEREFSRVPGLRVENWMA
nr:type II toxin-antitoxin system VapC family toxin [Rhizobium sp. RU20A]